MGILFSTEHLAGKSAEKPEKDTLAPLWEKHRDQVSELTLGVDIASLHRMRAWAKAERVLEIGAHKTNFLETLLDYFPEKEFVGIDLIHGKEGAAFPSRKAGTVSTVKAPIFSISSSQLGQFDFIFVHALSRSIADAKFFSKKVYELLRPGGTLIVYEIDESQSFLRPESGFDAFFDLFPELKASTSKGFVGLQQLSRTLQSSGLRLRKDSEIAFPSSYGDNKRQISKLVSLWLEIAEQSELLEWNFATARRSLGRWVGDPSSFGQLSVRRSVFQKPESILRRLLRFLFPF